MIVDKKILIPGIVMVVVGISFSLYLNLITPVGMTGMSDGEILELLIAQQESQDFTTLAGILIGVGFMFILISFGARRKRKGGTKKIEKKPEI